MWAAIKFGWLCHTACVCASAQVSEHATKGCKNMQLILNPFEIYWIKEQHETQDMRKTPVYLNFGTK